MLPGLFLTAPPAVCGKLGKSSKVKIVGMAAKMNTENENVRNMMKLFQLFKKVTCAITDC